MISRISLISLFLFFLFPGCSPSDSPKNSPEPSEIEAERLGQMILTGFRGTAISEEDSIYNDLWDHNLSGVVLFERDVITGDTARNIQNPSQLLQLSSQLIKGSPTSPIIAVDQEGGMVSRLNPEKGFPVSKSAAELGRIDEEDSTRFYARKMAQEFMVVGVNTNFGPVLDVNTNPDNPVIARYERSYSSDPYKVAKHAGYVLDEFDKEGILSVLKHFPGHGSSSTDSHTGFTDVTDSWSPDELIPYKILFEEREIHAVMTAHIYNANIDSVWPATLSPKTINGLLRDSLGFEGVVFSDDMQMEAITDQYGLETAIEQSIKAGVDILIFGNNLKYDEDIAEKAVGIIQKLLREGRLEKETVEASLARIEKLKTDVIAELCSCMTF